MHTAKTPEEEGDSHRGRGGGRLGQDTKPGVKQNPASQSYHRISLETIGIRANIYVRQDGKSVLFVMMKPVWWTNGHKDLRQQNMTWYNQFIVG